MADMFPMIQQPLDEPAALLDTSLNIYSHSSATLPITTNIPFVQSPLSHRVETVSDPRPVWGVQEDARSMVLACTMVSAREVNFDQMRRR